MCGVVDETTLEVQRPPLLPAGRAESDVLSSTIFGSSVRANDWCTAPFTMAGVNVMEDKQVIWNASNDEGSIKKKKFYNAVNAKCVFTKSPDFCDITAKPGNIYLVDIFRYGFCDGPEGTPIKMEEEDEDTVNIGSGLCCVSGGVTGYFTRLTT